MPYDTQLTHDLVNLLRHEHGLDPASAELAVIFGADPNAVVLDAHKPELQGFQFPALSYAAQTALAPGCTNTQRLSLLRTLIDAGADRANAAGTLLAVFSDLWQSHPATARRMVIGLHTLTTAVEPYIDGRRGLPRQPLPIAVATAERQSGPNEIPF
jgi:hypothetical protein